MKADMDIPSNHIKTDDIAFSAYLKMQGYPLITINQNGGKSLFEFNVAEQNANELKMTFINSEFISFYNELRNLKKLI